MSKFISNIKKYIFVKIKYNDYKLANNRQIKKMNKAFNKKYSLI